MTATIPNIVMLSPRKRKEMTDEILIKTKIIIDQLDMLMRDLMGTDKNAENIAFNKLGNIVNSIVKLSD